MSSNDMSVNCEAFTEVIGDSQCKCITNILMEIFMGELQLSLIM